MSRSSSDVFRDIKVQAALAERAAADAEYAMAHIRLGIVQDDLVPEAEEKLAYEVECRNRVLQDQG
jgi:hypothetical protein